MPRLLTRAAVVAVTAAATLALIAGPALAHVTVHPDHATQGGYAKLTFRVPTERDNASTVKLVVHFPRRAPIPTVSVKPHPGWSFQTRTRKLAKPIKTEDGTISQAVSTITWTADSPASAIKPGEFDEFAVSAGPLPKVKTMRFPAIQTYSSGEVVRWIQTAAPGAPEPKHPAPTLHLSASGDPGSSSGPSVTAASQSDHSSGGSSASLALAIAALVIAILAAAAALVLRRNSAGQ
jgi:uncharacterized protein YcnI